MLEEIREIFDRKFQTWLANGRLLSDSGNELGPPKGLISLMTVFQVNKENVRPLLDYRDPKEYVENYSAHAIICPQELRDRRQQGFCCICK